MESHILSYLWENLILQKSCSESSLLTIYARGPWTPILDTSNFLWNEQLTIILISGKMRSGFYIHLSYNWCWTWKSRDLRSPAIDGLLPLSSFSLSVSLWEIRQFISITELLRTRTDAVMSDGMTLERRYLKRQPWEYTLKSFIMTRSSFFRPLVC